MPSVTLSDAEVRQLLTGRLLVVRPFPKANMRYPNGAREIACAVYPAAESGYVPWYGDDHSHLARFTTQHYKHGIPNPLGAPGDVLACKEAFWFLWPENCENGLIYDEEHWELGRPVRDDECTVEYRADTRAARPGEWPDDEPDGPHWNPASTMPLWAVRHRPVVIETGVMRVGEFPGTDAERMGLNVVAKLPAFPPPRADIKALIDSVGKQVFETGWNRRFRKYPYESGCWAWWALVEVKEQQ